MATQHLRAEDAEPTDVTITRVIRVLSAWHHVSVADVARTVNMAKSTLERRYSAGGWTAREIAALSWAFGTPAGAFFTGAVDLATSTWAGTPKRPAPTAPAASVEDDEGAPPSGLEPETYRLVAARPRPQLVLVPTAA